MTTTSLYGTVTLGRIPTLFEDFTVREQPPGEELTLTVYASPTALPHTLIERIYHDLRNLPGQQIPVLFSDKAFLTGFYDVLGIDLSHWSYPGTAGGRRVVTSSADVKLRRVGFGNTVAVESRLSGAPTRTNDYAGGGQIWHAPAIGHSGYQAAAASPPVTRTGLDGPITVYRGLPAGTHPQWAVPATRFGDGRVRFCHATGDERSGERFPIAATTVTGGLTPSDSQLPGDLLLPDGGVATLEQWSLHNGLVRVQPLAAGGVISVAAYTGGGWRPTDWDIRIDAASIGPISSAEVIRNSYDTVTMRMTSNLHPGVATVDITVRRGSRFAELYLSTTFTGDLALARGTASAAVTGPTLPGPTLFPGPFTYPGQLTATTGWISAASNDGDGNRWIAGTARAATKNLTTGSITRPDATTLDAFVGHIVGGSTAQDGDTPYDLYNQYLGSLAEQMIVIRR